jgi:hypothetical protein
MAGVVSGRWVSSARMTSPFPPPPPEPRQSPSVAPQEVRRGWTRWVPWGLAVLFSLLWFSATQTNPDGTEVAPDLQVPFLLLAIGCLAWGVIKSRGPKRG